MKRTGQRMVLIGAAMLAGITALHGEQPLKQAVWVYPSDGSTQNPISVPSGRAALVQASAGSDVTDLYVSVYQSAPNSAGRLMYADADMADLIRQAHSRHIRVWAAYGNSDWPALGCAATSFPLQRIAEVVAYNAAHEDAEFDGVALDIEPPEPQSTADFQHLLTLYRACGIACRGGDRTGWAWWRRFAFSPPQELMAIFAGGR